MTDQAEAAEADGTGTAVWQVTHEGAPARLAVTGDGLVIATQSGDSIEIPWGDVSELTYPTSYSLRLSHGDGLVSTVGFAAAAEQRRFREVLDPATADARRASGSVILVTTGHVPGRDIETALGLCSGIGHPIAAPLSTTAQRGASALASAQRELSAAALRLGADAVIGIRLSSYSGGERGHQQAVGVHLLGTAVQLRARADAGAAANADGHSTSAGG